MNLTHFEWLLFDFDNTLVDFNASSKEAFVKVMTPLIDQDPKELYPIYNKINHLCWDEREAGLISHDELKVKRWNMFFDKIDIKYDPLTANNIYFEVIKTNPYWIDGAVDLLKAIQDKYRSFIITNGLSEVQNPRAEILGLAEYFEHIIISDEIGIAKPQKGFFDHCDKARQVFARLISAQADDIAGTALYLCSRAGAWTCGHIIVLDGGMTAKY